MLNCISLNFFPQKSSSFIHSRKQSLWKKHVLRGISLVDIGMDGIYLYVYKENVFHSDSIISWLEKKKKNYFMILGKII